MSDPRSWANMKNYRFAIPEWPPKVDPFDDLRDRLTQMQEYSYNEADLKKIRAIYPERLNGAWTRAQWERWFAAAKVAAEHVNWRGLEEAYGFKVERNEWGEVGA